MRRRYKLTGNDALDFSRYYNGRDEPPVFRRQYIDLKDKLFVPIDDPNLLSLSSKPEEDVIFHHFVKDRRQNQFVLRKNPPAGLYRSAYALTSSDLSVDSGGTFSCFNAGNIMKARISAFRMQNEFDLLVILTLIWGDESTYGLAFGNIEKGAVCAVSSQAVGNQETFRRGFVRAVETVLPEYVCWYGRVFDWVKEYYDPHRIVKMQTRTELIRQKRLRDCGKYQPSLFPESA